jgi:hypothetical protein
MMLAIVVDLGWVYLAANQLQNAADSAALAAAAQLADEDFLLGTPDPYDDFVVCRDSAEEFAAYNQAAQKYLALDRNDDNSVSGGIVVGYIENPLDLSSAFETEAVPEYNSVKVTAKLATALNGPLELFFGAVTGVENLEMGAGAVATLDDRVVGFELKDGETLPLFPYSISVDKWDEGVTAGDPIGASLSMLMGLDFLRFLTGVSCHWQSDGTLILGPNYPGVAEAGEVSCARFGRHEMTAAEFEYQIRHGVTEDDLRAIGGLVLHKDTDGVFKKWIEGCVGLWASCEDDLRAIIDEPRIIALHRGYSSEGSSMGSETHLEIVRFAAGKVTNVSFGGLKKNWNIKVAPYQVTTPQAKVDHEMAGSGLVYSLSLIR